MKLADLKRRLDRGKYTASRGYPELGFNDGVEMLMDVVVAPGKMALIFGNDSDSGPAPYRIVVFNVLEAIDGEAPVVACARAWPPAMWQFQRVTGQDVAVWDDRLDDYDDFEDVAIAGALAQLVDLAPEPTPELLTFTFVRWRSNTQDLGWVPAGVMLAKPDRSGILSAPFDGFEDEADDWSTRFEQVGENILDELPTFAGRDTDIEQPESIKATSFENAADRAKYRVAAEYYAATGKSLY